MKLVRESIRENKIKCKIKLQLAYTMWDGTKTHKRNQNLHDCLL